MVDVLYYFRTKTNLRKTMKKILYRLNTRSGGLLLATGLVLAGSAVAFDINSKDKAEHPTVTVPVDESTVARDTLPHGSYAPLLKKITPAVVKIVTTSRAENSSAQQMPGFDDPFWRRFFGDQFGQNGQNSRRGPQMPELQHGLGSGVIVTKEGYILTNNHVVDGAKEVKVTLQDGREFTAKVIGRDPKSDIAVVKIDAKDLPTIPLADSEKVEIGDVVLAIGNPFGIGQTVTSGIVSAKDRGNMGIEDYEDFIQTDAAINPGNSGGALVDINGRLIGINTAILSRSGGSQGVGFAIPSDTARTVMESLVKNGHVTRGYLGVMIQNVTPALADEFKLKDNKGALVGDVVPNGPADKAGLKNGDVVTEFNGHPVTDSRRLKLQVAETTPGTSVPLQLLRDGDKKTINVTIKELPGTDKLADADSSEKNDTGTLNGVEVADLDQQAHDQFNVPKNVKGAVVTQVDPNSAAAEAGLKPGDVILEINHQPVKSADEAVKLTEKSGDKRTLVRVWEKGGSHYVVVDENTHEG
jgi:serine protease Do